MLNDVAALYSDNPALFAGSVFVLGLVIGSFLNVVIYRLPIMLEREWRAQAAELTAPSAAARRRHRPRQPARPLHPEHPPLRLPGLQGADHGLAEHPGDQLAAACAAAARPARRRSPSAIRWWNSPPACCRRGWPGISASARRRPAPAGHLDTDRAHRHRYRSPVAARQHYPAADVGRLAGGGADRARCRGSPLPVSRARCHHRRGGGLFEPLAGISRLSPDHRQGRHGLRGFQAVRRLGRVAGMEAAAAGDSLVRRHRRGARDPHDRAARPRPRALRCPSGPISPPPAGSP